MARRVTTPASLDARQLPSMYFSGAKQSLAVVSMSVHWMSRSGTARHGYCLCMHELAPADTLNISALNVPIYNDGYSKNSV